MYNLTKVIAPLALFYGANDVIAPVAVRSLLTFL